MQVWSITSRVSDWPITADRIRTKTFRNRTRYICESWLLKIKKILAQLCMQRLQVCIRKWLSKASIERKLSNVS